VDTVKRFALLVALVILAAGAVNGQSRGDPPRVVQRAEAAPLPADAFFDDSLVRDISLTINSRDWQALQDHYLDDTYYPCDFRWQDQVVRNVGIRSRGNGSRSGVKPGLRVDFDRYTANQSFLGLKSFVLRNNTQDASNMHERLSMLLFHRMDIPASREAHVRLFINNANAGLYTLVESIDKDFLKRTFNENDGYLYKYDYPANSAPYYFEDRGPQATAYVPLPFKPETHETDPRPEFLVDLVQTINQTGEAAFRSTMTAYVDLAKFVRVIAVERFLADQDGLLSDYGGMNNFYFYRFQNLKQFAFIEWDKSEAFKGGVDSSIFHNITDVPPTQQNRLLSRALAYQDLSNLYLDTLLECVRSANAVDAGSPDQRGWLEREIEREYNQIKTPALSDPKKNFTNEEFEQAVRELTAFAQQRGASVTRQVTAVRPQ
jgi:spore coat protein H